MIVTIISVVLICVLLFVIYWRFFYCRYDWVRWDSEYSSEHSYYITTLWYTDKEKPGIQITTLHNINFSTFMCKTHIKSMNKYERYRLFQHCLGKVENIDLT